MGICLSCLGSRDESDEAERQRLLDADPYAQPHHGYGGWHQTPTPNSNARSLEEQQREQEAMHNIMRWASEQIVEIFPVSSRHQQPPSTPNLNSSIISLPPHDDVSTHGHGGLTSSQHQDILLSMIPGDKSKRSIRIYPASRPGTADAQSVRSKASQTKLNGSMRSSRHKESVFVKLNVDFP